jgi:hypothetical protein
VAAATARVGVKEATIVMRARAPAAEMLIPSWRARSAKASSRVNVVRVDAIPGCYASYCIILWLRPPM